MQARGSDTPSPGLELQVVMNEPCNTVLGTSVPSAIQEQWELKSSPLQEQWELKSSAIQEQGVPLSPLSCSHNDAIFKFKS